MDEIVKRILEHVNKANENSAVIDNIEIKKENFQEIVKKDSDMKINALAGSLKTSNTLLRYSLPVETYIQLEARNMIQEVSNSKTYSELVDAIKKEAVDGRAKIFEINKFKNEKQIQYKQQVLSS